jgi:hypothetical protein
MTEYRTDLLHGRWVHSHEEDTRGEMVFRPADHSFPPSRGRTSFELRPDGTYLESSPGPVDAPEESRGRWSLDGDRLLLGGEGGSEGRTWEISAAEDDRLVIKK